MKNEVEVVTPQAVAGANRRWQLGGMPTAEACYADRVKQELASESSKMSTPRAIVFVDGENLVFRYQDMLANGRSPSNTIVHIPGVFVWHPQITEWCMMSVARVYFYTSIVGADGTLAANRDQIARVTFKYYKAGGWGVGQIVPMLFKKSAKSRKTRQVDIQITIDMMRFAHNSSFDVLYLVSGDGDYIPLLQEVMRHGKEIYVAALSSGLASELPSSVDQFRDLDAMFFQPVNPELPGTACTGRAKERRAGERQSLARRYG